MARAGFPWLCVDMEHSPIDWGLASTLFGFIAEAGSVPLCRVPNGTHENIKRALDAGAWGIVAPMVDTVGCIRNGLVSAASLILAIHDELQVEQAREIIAACKYPPEGTRSGESPA
jgi:4-hydroxy-2-oxoheptanedioate aldolase